MLAKALIDDGPLPKKTEIDAYHIAVATSKWYGLSADVELYPYSKCSYETQS